MAEVKDNPAQRRYEMEFPGGLAFVNYRRDGQVVSLLHAEVPPEFEGKGYASALIKGTLDLLRAEGSRVIPLCSFAAAFIKRHKDYEDLVARQA